MPSLPAALSNRFAALPRFWRELTIIGIILLTLQALEPLTKHWVRDVLDQHASDQQLHDLADEIVLHTLLCRRFEKDMLLNLNDKHVRSAYSARWEQAVTELDLAIAGFEQAALSSADRSQAEMWRIKSTQYRAGVLQTLQAIDTQGIDHPTAANQRLSAAKDAIRTVSDTAQAVARDKEQAAQSSGQAIQHALITSTRVIMLLLLGGGVLYTFLTRR